MGGANYTKLAVPGSYINVMDFKTVKQLAEYLQYLDKNNTAYNEYFRWRLKYNVSGPFLITTHACSSRSCSKVTQSPYNFYASSVRFGPYYKRLLPSHLYYLCSCCSFSGRHVSHVTHVKIRIYLQSTPFSSGPASHVDSYGVYTATPNA